MELLYSVTSPYSAKVRMAARHLGIDITNVAVDTNAEPATLVDNNPLGKIPVLLLDDGGSVYDSVAIMHYLDRLSGGKLYPKKNGKRTEAEILEALCDGIMDCLLAIVYERRSRPEDRVHQPWIDKQWKKAVKGLDHLNANLPKTGKKLHGGHFALAALIGYLDLRFAGEWAEGHEALAQWPETFGKRFEAYKDMRAAA
ncbi:MULTISPECIES: glutathione S-transferase [Rhizobium/Agrobacterium group]|jgi:glutathione S-transferase|uniref:Glutathione S-transferase n=2 Tax=Rhizobium/Agrobacterium group TaxID=227290 RepID=A0A1B9U9P7_AGRTU|nr:MULTISPECIES: glutathione S-transferase [Rhizobium/Agrobacterium group]EHJ99475.1 glutathione S-transferase domain-containing protein [Agrobacterium tumefaciens 5A]MDP9559142.1 glutathione S-transferase [Rhizobium nepotum]AYM10364.1 glutathione S-transferase related protein [Agrobacterium tumefaciens]KAA3507195.1 glutathione S-transferase [Agrobacterium tumefaciens]KAA3531366.1 glutathione S-transferase [Agrobacterium tumefaciens]